MGRRGWKFQASSHSLMFLVTSPIQERSKSHLIRNKRNSYLPGNCKGFRSSVSGTRVKDQILEQNMLLAFFSLRILQVFWELCARNWGQRTIYIYFYYLTGIWLRKYSEASQNLRICLGSLFLMPTFFLKFHVILAEIRKQRNTKSKDYEQLKTTQFLHLDVEARNVTGF